MPGFTLVIDGKVVEVRKSLAELEQDLKQFKTQLKTSMDSRDVSRLNIQIKETEVLMKRIKNISLDGGGIARSSGQATAALVDLSRVANDVPYGMAGIANNISPMIESFGRLKAETGSASAALKAMAGSIIGPVGLGLAINLITSAFIIYQNGIAGFNRRTKEAKEETDSFIKSLKQASDLAAQAAASEEGNIAKIRALGAVITDTTQSYQERNRALGELKNINKAYFGDLDLESTKLAAITAKINEYTDAIKAQAVLKGFTDEIARVSVEIAKQDSQLTKLQNSLQAARARLAAQGEPLRDETGQVISSSYLKAEKAVTEAEKAFLTQRETVETLATNFAELSGQVDAATKRVLQYKSTTSGGDSKTEDALKKQLEFYERIAKVVTDVNRQVEIGEKILSLRTRILIRDAPGQGLTEQEIQDTIRGYQQEFQEVLNNQALQLEGVTNIRFSPTVKVEIPSNVSFFLDKSGHIQTKLNDEIAKAVGGDKKIPTITLHQARVRLLGEKMTAEIENKEALQKELNKVINDALFNLQVEGLTGLGEMIGGAISGGMDGVRSAAKNMLATLGGIIQQLGKYVITTALKIKALKEIIEKWAIANPTAAIAAGIGLVALGAMLRNVNFGTTPKLAHGGIATGPTPAIVGEAGSELILPLNRLPQIIGQMGGGGSGNITIGLGIRGREIVPWLAEETRRFNRGF